MSEGIDFADRHGRAVVVTGEHDPRPCPPIRACRTASSDGAEGPASPPPPRPAALAPSLARGHVATGLRA